MDKEELKEYLPHREPMLLVDRMEIDEEGICHAEYRVKEDEVFCRGHFPGNPIVPGVIQCEIMAQSCALLVKDEIKGKFASTVSSLIGSEDFKEKLRTKREQYFYNLGSNGTEGAKYIIRYLMNKKKEKENKNA